MTRIKSFLIVLSIIGLFVFVSCKNNYTPEQAKVACNAEKTTIKGIAKIEDKFVPEGTIIKLYRFPKKLEDIIVSDDEGHFESKNQYNVNPWEIFPFILKIDEDRPITFKTKIYNLSVKEDTVYNFEGEAVIEGYATLDGSSRPVYSIELLSKKNNSNCIGSYNVIETIAVDSSNGHFTSRYKYNKHERSKYVMRITTTILGVGTCHDTYWHANVSTDLSSIPRYIFKK